MKIDSKIFTSFLKQIPATEIRLEFKDEGILIEGMDEANVIYFKCLLKSSQFFSYEKQEDMIIDKNNVFMSLLDKFTSNIELKIKDKLLIKDNFREVYIPLLQRLEKSDYNPKLNWKYKINIDSNIFKNLIKDANTLNIDEIRFKNTPEMLILEVDSSIISDKMIKINLPTDIQEDIYAKYPVRYLDIISNINDIVEVSFYTDYPLKVYYNNDIMELLYIIPPRVET